MKLLPHWWDVLKRAWSIRLMIIAAVLSGIEIALPLLDGVIDIPRGLFAAASGITTAAAFVARLVAQENIPHEK